MSLSDASALKVYEEQPSRMEWALFSDREHGKIVAVGGR